MKSQFQSTGLVKEMSGLMSRQILHDDINIDYDCSCMFQENSLGLRPVFDRESMTC